MVKLSLKTDEVFYIADLVQLSCRDKSVATIEIAWGLNIIKKIIKSEIASSYKPILKDFYNGIVDFHKLQSKKYKVGGTKK